VLNVPLPAHAHLKTIYTIISVFGCVISYKIIMHWLFELRLAGLSPVPGKTFSLIGN